MFIPAYNERSTGGRLPDAVATVGYAKQIVVVDDSCADGDGGGRLGEPDPSALFSSTSPLVYQPRA